MCIIVIEMSVDGYSNDRPDRQSPTTRHHNVKVHRFAECVFFPLLFSRKMFDVKIICSIAFNKNQLNCSLGEWQWSEMRMYVLVCRHKADREMCVFLSRKHIQICANSKRHSHAIRIFSFVPPLIVSAMGLGICALLECGASLSW